MAMTKQLRWSPKLHHTIEFLVLKGDLTRCPTEAIVNAANGRLIHGGGLAAAISRAGGSVINEESRKWVQQHGEIPVGKTAVTKAGQLPCKYVIHAVGPCLDSRGNPTLEDQQLLRNAVTNSLKEAARLKLQSIALPGISSGIFGYPRDQAAQEIVQSSFQFVMDSGNGCSLKKILFMNFDDPTFEAFAVALQSLAQSNGAIAEVYDGDLFQK